MVCRLSKEAFFANERVDFAYKTILLFTIIKIKEEKNLLRKKNAHLICFFAS